MTIAKDITLLREAVAAAKAGDKPTARALLLDVLDHNPRNEQAWLWRAALAENRDEAASHLEKVLDINPNNTQALNSLTAYRASRTRTPGAPAAAPPSSPTAAALAPSHPPAPPPAPLARTTATAAVPVAARPPVMGPVLVRNAAPKLELASKEPEAVPIASLACPLCGAAMQGPPESCTACRAVLSLASPEAVLAAAGVDEKLVSQGVERLLRLAAASPSYELHCQLALAYLNLKNSSDAVAQLRAALALRPADAAAQRPLEALLARRLVLVVDDSATVRKVVTHALERAGYRVQLASDGMQALAKLDEEMPKLVLLDITMPRMDGYQVCKVIKQNKFTRGIPVLMLSGNDGFFDRVKGRIAGATDYLTKPFEPKTLIGALEKHLKSDKGAK